MRFDGKSTGLFSDEEPKKKRKKRIKITEDQYNRLFNLNEEDEASTDSGSSYVTSGYQYAYQYVNTAGGAVETRSTSNTHIQYSSTGSDSRNNNGYAYFYNLGNSTKYRNGYISWSCR